MKVTICIGSSCHLKGAGEVMDTLQSLIQTNQLENSVDLAGAFCMGKCQQGVCVTVDDAFYSVEAASAKTFFENYIKKAIA